MAVPEALTRRQALGAMLACLSASGLRPARAASGAPPPITKPIPSTGERLPVIGLGTDSFRTSEVDNIRAELKLMPELGGSVIDTAAAYGDSESIIGNALAELKTRDRFFIATKLTAEGFLGPGGEASLQRSLERLKVSRIDLLQVHNLNGVDTLMPLLQQWKHAGRIRYVGITTSRVSQHADLVEAMRKYPMDFIQVDYSIANREAATTVFPVALERRLAVLVNLPLARASLIGEAGSHALPDWAAEIDVSSWSQFFLKYVVSHPAVTCAIPGSTKPAHLQDNQAAAHGRLPDAAMRLRMEQLWDSMSR